VSDEIDTSVAHPARRYNYWLGGTVNFPADRESADAMAAIYPAIRELALENRKFLRRAVEFLAAEGVDQFLDIGTGIPSPGGVAEIAPDATVLHVDNDPIVGQYVQGHYLEADLRQPAAILDAAREVFDFDRPIGLLLFLVLHFVRDEQDPYGSVATLVDALPAGSYVVITHGTYDHVPPENLKAADDVEAKTTSPARVRSKAEIAEFFAGLELVAPGLVGISEWRDENEPAPRPSVEQISCYGGVARVR
jgi:hypothetical protein